LTQLWFAKRFWVLFTQTARVKKCPTTAVMVEAFFKASFFQTEPKHLKPKSSVTKHARVEA
jgi:hypothetical protein